MAYIPRSSFTPKEISSAIPMQVRRRRSIHMFSLISTFILLASFAAAIGVYFYQDYLNTQLEAAKQGLNTESSPEDERKMEEIRIYDNKLTIAHTLLDNHIAASRLFEEIEDSTKMTVQFKSLEYSYDPGFEASLVLGGNTEEFASVALQKMQYLEDSIFSEYVINEITSEGQTLNEDGTAVVSSSDETGGKVNFNVEGVFKKEYIEYTGVNTTGGVTESAIETSPDGEPSVPEVTTNDVTPQ